MLNSKKLLYIFSDVAYITELLPAKKKGEFVIQEFRQINGEFLDNNELIAPNIEKLFSKIDSEEYTLILPDFLFTNTIIEVKEKAKTKVEKYINEKLLPSLKISLDTHQVKHFVLTQYGDKSKVQLSALEKTLLTPIFDSAAKHEIKIAGVASLSWTIKSLVSLEPSLSVVQMGEQVYLAQHYIGIDQANHSSVTDVEKLGETIATLKGAEPSTQTVYLLTNELVEEKLKDQLKATLPLQQLSDFKDDKSEIPSYVKQIIEAGAKTLSVTDFNVPDFKLEKATAQLDSATGALQTSTPKEEEDVAKKTPKKDFKDETSSLPEPTVPSVTAITSVAAASITGETEEATLETYEETETVVEAITDIAETESDSDTTKTDTAGTESDSDTTEKPEVLEESSLSQFSANGDEEDKVEESRGSEKKEKAVKEDQTTKKEDETDTMEEKNDDKPTVIKNKTGVNSMLKMVFISIAVFFATIAVGVGLGLGFITLSQRDSNESEQIEVVAENSAESEVAEEASPTPSPEPEINKDEISILVVNATTKAGHAGTFKKLFIGADFTDVNAGNAKGDYEEGNYVLMIQENTALISLLEEVSELELEYSDETLMEDAKGNYDVVVVLAE